MLRVDFCTGGHGRFVAVDDVAVDDVAVDDIADEVVAR